MNPPTPDPQPSTPPFSTSPTKRSHLRPIVGLSVAVMTTAALVLAGCGNSGSNAPTDGPAFYDDCVPATTSIIVDPQTGTTTQLQPIAPQDQAQLAPGAATAPAAPSPSATASPTGHTMSLGHGNTVSVELAGFQTRGGGGFSGGGGGSHVSSGGGGGGGGSRTVTGNGGSGGSVGSRSGGGASHVVSRVPGASRSSGAGGGLSKGETTGTTHGYGGGSTGYSRGQKTVIIHDGGSYYAPYRNSFGSPWMPGQYNMWGGFPYYYIAAWDAASWGGPNPAFQGGFHRVCPASQTTVTIKPGGVNPASAPAAPAPAPAVPAPVGAASGRNGLG